MRDYSKDFEEQDRIEEDKERGAVVEERKRVFSEWMAWRERTREELKEEGGLGEEDEEEEEARDGARNGYAGGEGAEVDVEEIVEEVLDELEEVIGK